MKHPEELFATYVEGRSTPEEVATVEAHLSGCASCRIDLERARAARTALAALPELEAPGLALPGASPTRSIASRRGPIPVAGDGRPAAEGPAAKTRQPRASRYAWAAGLAAAAVVAAMFLFLGVGRWGGGGQNAGSAARSGSMESAADTGALVDYSRGSLKALAGRLVASGLPARLGPAAFSTIASPSQTPSPSEASPPSGPNAAKRQLADTLDCVTRAIGGRPGRKIELLKEGTFEGVPAYIAAYLSSPNGDRKSLVLSAVRRRDCRPLYVVRRPL